VLVHGEAADVPLGAAVVHRWRLRQEAALGLDLNRQHGRGAEAAVCHSSRRRAEDAVVRQQHTNAAG
jgi:hypothetical protein